MRRGDVRGYPFDHPDKQRPVLILTRDSAIGYLTSVTVAPITSTIRNIPSEVRLRHEDGMRYDRVANLDTIQTVPKAKIASHITYLSTLRMEEVQQALCFALGVDDL
ncbi:MAG: type II toxin-antitoxin system PemK/MazF family toxin [Ardenticatenales bacterium]|nr:type II toxin-antitoxin system PemK/MazF family toxin [Ardenticatenales bacterium]MCB9172824.1 type II toxin-antitoxin system PemK/MazF family toxin [Ardenticatenales bacterium]